MLTEDERIERHRKYNRERYHRIKDSPGYKKKLQDYYLKHQEAFQKKGRDRYHQVVKADPALMLQHRERSKEAARRVRARKNEVKIKLQGLLGGACADCGITNPLLLDFDHINPLTKSMMISQSLHLPFKLLKKEIKKCQLLCPNCHRIKTFSQGGFNPNVREYRNRKKGSSF